MLFYLQQGDFLETLVLQTIERGLPLPEVVANAPEIADESLAFYLTAFYQLDTERRREGGPIPVSAMWAYADRFEISGDDCEDFVYIVRSIDAGFIAHNNEKAKAKAKRGSKTRKGRGNGGKG